MIILPTLVARAAVSAFTVAAILFSAAPEAAYSDTGFDPSRSVLKACPRDERNSNCVSSNGLEPPNRYVSPLKTLNDRDTAFRRAVRDLSVSTSGATLVESNPNQYYLHVTVPGTVPNSLDDIELLFLQDGGTVQVRCDARVALPPAPFCIQKNCINGAQDQRDRVQRIAQQLGLPAADQAQMKASAKWTPIFFNADRVPDFLEDDNY